MEIDDPFIHQLTEMSGIPMVVFQELLSGGANIAIPKMTILNLPIWLKDRSYYLTEGIVREYYIDKNGNEHTMRFVQAPSLIAPSWIEYYIQSETIITSQSLTPLKGMYWPMNKIMDSIKTYPQLYKFIIGRIILDIKEKNQKEIRLHNFTARERYMLFLEEFPGLVNQVPLKYVASYLNMTAETISRIRAQMTMNENKDHQNAKLFQRNIN